MALKIRTVMTYPLTGAVDFAITFEYLARKFVTVTLIGKDRKELVLNQDYRFTTKTQITTTRAWTAADGYDSIEIRRFTSATERLVDFADGSILRAYDLNIAQIQTLHVAEEARDLTADTIGVNNDGHLDARGRRIVNVADGIEPGDAISLGQVTRWNESALNSKNAAKVSETNSKDSENKAKASETSAKNSENLAHDWAQKAEDSPVTGSEYSAYHYSRKALVSTNAAAASAAASLASQNAAKVSEDNAKVSETNAKASEVSAKAEATKLAQFNDIVDRMNSVAVAQVGSFELHNSRTYAKPGTVYGDGQISQRSLYPELVAELLAGHLPVVTDDVWLSTPSKRGCFSLGDGTTTFRFPDLNGVYAGSIKAPVFRGDAGFTIGDVQASALPNITGSFGQPVFSSSGTIYEGRTGTGAFTPVSPQTRYRVLDTVQTYQGTSPEYPTGYELSASNSSAIYTDGMTEVRSNAIVIVWVVRTHGVVNNPGSVDAAVLASRVEQVYTELNNKINDKADFQIVAIPAAPALGSRNVIANPFGNYVPVICQFEYKFSDGNWYDPKWLYHSVNGSYGAKATYAQGIGIVYRIGETALAGYRDTGCPAPDTSSVPTAREARILVWKVKR